MGELPQLCQGPANLAEGLHSITTCGSSLPACLPSRAFWSLLERTEDWQAGRAQAAWKKESHKDTLGLFLTLVYLKNKKPKKKKKTTNNFIYKVKLKPRIMERGKNYGRGKRAGPEPIPHSEHKS